MCGICGAINFSGLENQDNLKIKIINNSLEHRGPDNEGFYNSANVVFGHRRLSIVDLSAESNQPMMDDDESIIIVFNGEIYNSEEIRKELEKDYHFKTSHSDTETIIYAYKKWGVKAIDRFIGMFGLAIYDKNLNKCFLFRDRLGKKPVYYTIDEKETLFFSSEIQPLFSAKVLKKEINDEAIYHYLSILTIDAPSTFFKNIKKIEAGHYIEIGKEGLKTHKYWDVSEFINKENLLSEKDAINETERLLSISMKHRNVSDVPISVALSGGLDSSLNLHYSTQDLKLKKNISGINISYTEVSEFDESKIAQKFAEESKIEFISKKIDNIDFEKWIEDYLGVQKDIPSGDINTSLVYGMSLISKDRGAKVMLVGEGGDELGGYPVYKQLLKYHNYFSKTPKFILKLAGLFSKKIKNEVDVFLANNDLSIRRFIFGFREHEKKKFWLKNGNYDTYKLLSKYSNEITTQSNDQFYRKILNVEYKVRLAELILPRIDYPSMAASIEARSPFMDHKLIEFMSGLSFDLKMKNYPKYILKEISKDKLPEYILNQPKVGFGQLLIPFFKNTLPKWYKRDILDNDSPLNKYISKKFLSNLYYKKDYSYRMWLLYSLHKWLKVNN